LRNTLVIEFAHRTSRFCQLGLFYLLWFLPFSANATPPNILLIYVDDLGYGDLASYGHPVIATPHLDKLAASGLRLTNYYAPSALCSPSRAGLLTGRQPYRTGIKSWIPEGSGIFLKSEEITLAELLKAQGYQTALIGKWHLNSNLASLHEPQPNDQGFDYFYGHNAFQIPTNKNPTNLFRNRQLLGTQTGYTAQLYADEAIAWLQARQERPFFLMLSMAEPHTTFENPPSYNEQYAKYIAGEVVPIPSGEAQPPKDKLIARGPGEYYANVTYMDAQLGRVLAWLEEHKSINSNTIVVFASDNGPVTSQWINWWEVNAHGSTGGLRGRKHYLYEGGIKVPAFIRYPKHVAANSVSDELVVGMDIYTTLAYLAGAEIPTDRPIDGINISPIFNGEPLPKRTLMWALTGALEFAIRKRNWKLLIDEFQQPQALYNLEHDPLELFNLIASEPVKTAELMAAFTANYASVVSNKPMLQ
jgi:arylsulfatase